MKKIFVLLLVPFLFSCTSKPVKELEAGKKFAIAFVSSRQLEIEPCGCSFAPVGGFEREFNLLESWRKDGTELLVLNGGVSLFPVQFEKGNDALYRKKANYLFEGIKAMGGDVLSPAAIDTYLGVSELKKLSSKWNVKLISANLFGADGKRLFDPYVVKGVPGGKALVVGLAGPLKETISKEKVTVKPPAEVMPEILAEAKDKLVIVITDMPKKDREDLMAKFPVHIVLGGPVDDETMSAKQIKEDQLYLNPKTQGRSVARLDLNLKFPLTEFYNATTGNEFLFARVEARKEIDALEKELKGKLSKIKRAQAEEKLRSLKAYVKQTAKIPYDPMPTSSTYDSSVRVLEPELASPANPMTDLFKRYKQEVETSARNGEF